MWEHVLIWFLSVVTIYGNPLNEEEVELFRPGRIVGGKTVKDGAYPFQVSIQRLASYSPTRYYHTCGGALVEPDVVITAAHCAKGHPILYVAAGMNNIHGSRRNRVIVQKSYIAEYNDKTKANDIAILKLSKKFKISRSGNSPIDVIDIPPDGYKPTGDATIIGWGKVKHNGMTPKKLHAASVPLMEHTECQKRFGTSYTIGEKMLCAGGGSRDACQGDSGGPMVCYGSKQERYLCGITSWGIGCATPRVPGVYTDVVKYRSFIQSSLKKIRQMDEKNKIQRKSKTQRKHKKKIKKFRRKHHGQRTTDNEDEMYLLVRDDLEDNEEKQEE